MKIDLPVGTEIIVITGPESCGKTTLVNRLKTIHGLPVVGEFARTYLEQKEENKYTYEDLLLIAQCQITQESNAHQQYPLIVCDTDIVTIDIWAREVFDRPINIPNQYENQKYYMLCKPDIPWEPDPLRENPEDRDRLYEVYLRHLKYNNLSFIELDDKMRQEVII